MRQLTRAHTDLADGKRSSLIGVVTLTLCMALAACSSTGSKDAALADGQRAQPSTSGAAGADAQRSQRSVAELTVPNQGDGAQGAPNRRSVYFGYDQYGVEGEGASVVQANADWANRSRPARIVVEGNADDRGSREYNLALGQKRAEAVRRAMMSMGVPGDRIEAVSFGEERPKAVGQSEDAWAENRRADLQYR